MTTEKTPVLKVGKDTYKLSDLTPTLQGIQGITFANRLAHEAKNIRAALDKVKSPSATIVFENANHTITTSKVQIIGLLDTLELALQGTFTYNKGETTGGRKSDKVGEL